MFVPRKTARPPVDLRSPRHLTQSASANTLIDVELHLLIFSPSPIYSSLHIPKYPLDKPLTMLVIVGTDRLCSQQTRGLVLSKSDIEELQLYFDIMLSLVAQVSHHLLC
jgi:hypothetical protein